MNATLRRRLGKIEEFVESAKPKPPQEVVLIGQPAVGAPQEGWEMFMVERRSAIKRGAFVIVMVPLKSP